MLETQPLQLVKVYSPFLDNEVRSKPHNADTIIKSKLWDECYHQDEISDVEKPLFVYHFKFNGLKPVQMTNVFKTKS